MKLWTFVVVAAMSAIPGRAATFAWKGSASGGDWTLASNWNSSDGTFVLTDANDYDFSALADGARVVNDASNLTKIKSLV